MAYKNQCDVWHKWERWKSNYLWQDQDAAETTDTTPPSDRIDISTAFKDTASDGAGAKHVQGGRSAARACGITGTTTAVPSSPALLLEDRSHSKWVSQGKNRLGNRKKQLEEDAQGADCAMAIPDAE